MCSKGASRRVHVSRLNGRAKSGVTESRPEAETGYATLSILYVQGKHVTG